MPDARSDTPPAENRRWRVVSYAVVATQDFLADDVPRLAAAMSYFLLLALAPVVLLANVLFQALGLLTGHAPQAPTITSASEAASAGYQQASAWAGSFAPWVIGALVIVGVLSVFAQFVQSVDLIWKTPKRGNAFSAFLRPQGLALALLAVAAAAFVVALLVAAVVGILVGVGLSYAQALGVDVSALGRNDWVRVALVYTASALLFVVAFSVTPDRPVRWLDVVPSALFTAVLFAIGTEVLSVYLSTTQRFVVFGAAQFFVALTVWIYYAAIVALWGVELSRVMVLAAEGRRGEARDA